MKLNQILTAAAVMLLVAAPAFATTTGNATANTAGAELLTALNGLLTGNLMLFVGLGVAVFGLWMWLVKQETMVGLFMIIGGVALTAAPALFNATSKVVTPVADQIGDGTSQSGQSVTN